MPNILGRKGNQTMKFGQLIEYHKSTIFLKKSCMKGGRETSSRPLCFLKKLSIYEVKVSGRQLSFDIFWWPSNLAYNKSKLYETYYWSRDMLNCDFLEKDLGVDSPSHLVYDFSRKLFLMLYSINWPSLIDNQVLML